MLTAAHDSQCIPLRNGYLEARQVRRNQVVRRDPCVHCLSRELADTTFYGVREPVLESDTDHGDCEVWAILGTKNGVKSMLSKQIWILGWCLIGSTLQQTHSVSYDE